MKIKIVLFLSILFCLSCTERDIKLPKQRGYFRIDFPERTYYSFEKKEFPYFLKLPNYSEVTIDSSKTAEPFWINIQYPKFNATIHISYKHIQHNLTDFVDDAHFLAYKHDVKAEAIKTEEFHYPDKDVHGLLFDIKGNAASVKQFVITDSLTHFIRGALYFNVPPNKDSLAPVISFMHEDIVNLISTFKWNPQFSYK